MKIACNIALGEVKPINLNALEGFIGQNSVIKKVRFFAESSSNETPFPTLLFTGSHGLGKTYLAEKVSKVLGRKFISVNCGTIKKHDDFFKRVITKIDGPTTIFLDESHNLSSEITTILLSLLNPTDNHINKITFDGLNILYDMKYVNLIFATTDAHMMFRPLRNRCYKVYFTPYSKKDLLKIMDFYLEDVTLYCDLDEISDSCRSRARDAFLLSQNIKRYVSVKNTKAISREDWNDIKDTFDIFPRGLSKEEVELLELIRDSGPISCGNLALRLMVNEDNIKSELEVRLRELGLIESTSKGRNITEEGRRYFREEFEMT
jgi:Holliday junction resolvasome RuvABC ATP-dependent DNA helicase subunit